MLVSNILKKEDSKELQTNQPDTGKVLQKIIKQLIGKRIENNTINYYLSPPFYFGLSNLLSRLWDIIYRILFIIQAVLDVQPFI